MVVCRVLERLEVVEVGPEVGGREVEEVGDMLRLEREEDLEGTEGRLVLLSGVLRITGTQVEVEGVGLVVVVSVDEGVMEGGRGRGREVR